MLFDVPSNTPEPMVVSEEQVCHALVKFVPLLISSAGKDVRGVQDCHALLKFRTLLVSIIGNEVSAVF